MASTILLRGYSPGESLALLLYTMAGGVPDRAAAVNGEGTEMPPVEGNAKIYAADVDVAPDTYWADVVFEDGDSYAVGVVHVVGGVVCEIADQAKFLDVAVSSVESGSGGGTGGLVRVDSFTEGALQSLSGSTIRRRSPAWTMQGFDDGITQGDSYIGPLAWVLRLTNFTGQNLETASSIKMMGSRNGSAPFEWEFSATKIDDTTYDLTAELTSEQTSIDKGQWNVSLVAHWEATDSSPEQTVTLIGPRAPLQIKGT